VARDPGWRAGPVGQGEMNYISLSISRSAPVPPPQSDTKHHNHREPATPPFFLFLAPSLPDPSFPLSPLIPVFSKSKFKIILLNGLLFALVL
jgi:hypothetical protein